MRVSPITEADLQAHVDGRLPPGRAAEVSDWLDRHPQEAERIKDYRKQRDALRSALDPVLEEPLPASLDLGLRDRSRDRSTPGRPVLAASLAAALLIGGAGGWTLRGWRTPPNVGTAALAQEAVASYTVYASDPMRPVELDASSRQALDSWFSARLSQPIASPDLEAAGLQLIGGRLVATGHGPACLYFYRDRSGGRVALYIRPMEVDRMDRMQPRSEGLIRGWTWADNGLGFGVFGTAPADFLHGAANLVRARFARS